MLEFNSFQALALTHLTENCCLSVFLLNKSCGHQVIISPKYSDGTTWSQVTTYSDNGHERIQMLPALRLKNWGTKIYHQQGHSRVRHEES